MGKFRCTQIRTSNSCSSKRNSFLAICFLGSEYFAQRFNQPFDKNPKKIFFRVFVKRSIKPLGKICNAPPPKKKKLKKSVFFSELQALEVWICVQANFPVIVLILLNGIHKFQRSWWLNSRGRRGVFLSVNESSNQILSDMYTSKKKNCPPSITFLDCVLWFWSRGHPTGKLSLKVLDQMAPYWNADRQV